MDKRCPDFFSCSSFSADENCAFDFGSALDMSSDASNGGVIAKYPFAARKCRGHFLRIIIHAVSLIQHKLNQRYSLLATSEAFR